MPPKPVTFFGLVFVLSIPFWVLGSATGASLLPGLPIAALMALCPVLAALILTLRSDGTKGAGALLARAFDARRIGVPGWWTALLVIVPAVSAACVLVLRGQGVAVPPPRIEVVPTLALGALFLVGALCEELGWSGYAIDPLQARWGALRASLILGAVWAVWHFIPLLQAERSIAWIAWWTLGTVATRVQMVWLFNRTGRSVFGQALFHAAANLSWQLFPVQGSFWDPRVYGPIMALTALAMVIGGARRPSPGSPRAA